MFQPIDAFSSFSTNDIAKSKEFYSQVLGLEVEEQHEGLTLSLPGDGKVMVYPKDNHTPASFTVLHFVVKDINETVDNLVAQGVTFERYEGEMATDEKGIYRGSTSGYGPDIAWCKDPAGNIIGVLESSIGTE